MKFSEQQQRLNWIHNSVDEYTDSHGEVDTIDLIDAVAEHFGLSLHTAEQLVELAEVD